MDDVNKKRTFGFGIVSNKRGLPKIDPQVIAVSCEGLFRITPPVSRALDIGSGEHVMFLNNFEKIDEAVSKNTVVVKDFCKKNGLQPGTAEARIAVHREFDMWAVAKGIIEYSSSGDALAVTERLTQEDKMRYVMKNFSSMMEEAKAHADEATVYALTCDGVTREEQMNILTAFVAARQIPKYQGSKTINMSGLKGAGLTQTFTDINVWRQLKADMGEDALRLNRVFEIDLDDVQFIPVFNGYEDVNVKAFILGSYTDKVPVRVGKNC